MPGNCGIEALCFRNSTDWFREELNFSIAAMCTERLVETRPACALVVMPLVSIMKDQVEELIRLGLRAFTIGV